MLQLLFQKHFLRCPQQQLSLIHISFHDGCVKTVASGMKLRDDASASLSKIKEDAEDIRYDEKSAESAEEDSSKADE